VEKLPLVSEQKLLLFQLTRTLRKVVREKFNVLNPVPILELFCQHISTMTFDVPSQTKASSNAKSFHPVPILMFFELKTVCKPVTKLVTPKGKVVRFVQPILTVKPFLAVTDEAIVSILNPRLVMTSEFVMFPSSDARIKYCFFCPGDEVKPFASKGLTVTPPEGKVDVLLNVN
jgi:hypothetical protein